MIVYNKGGQDFILMSTNMRGVLKAPTASFGDVAPILTPVQVEDRVGVVPETIAALTGIEQLDKLDETRAIVLARTDLTLDLRAIALP
jgi:hypothetical protein